MFDSNDHNGVAYLGSVYIMTGEAEYLANAPSVSACPPTHSHSWSHDGLGVTSRMFEGSLPEPLTCLLPARPCDVTHQRSRRSHGPNITPGPEPSLRNQSPIQSWEEQCSGLCRAASGSRLKICLVTVNRKYERLFLYSKFQIETGITKKLTNKLNKIS